VPEALEAQGPLNDDVMGRFLEKLINAPDVKPLLSDEHFPVDGTLLARTIHRPHHQALARGFGAPKPGRKRAKGDSRGIKLSIKTHRSGSDSDALLARQSNVHPAQPSYRGHVLMDNRHGLIWTAR
jgi:hypothetical protein